MTKRNRKSRRSSSPRRGMHRRDALKMGASSMAALGAFEWMVSGKAHAQSAATNPAEKLLFVFTATGGGSISDSFMAVRESDVSTPERAGELICYPENDVWAKVTAVGGTGATPESSPDALSCVDVYSPVRNAFGPGVQYFPSDFAAAHLNDIAVMSVQNTSVNHFIAQTRALTGAGIHGGRTIGEAVAERYGQNLVLPFVNMGSGGYIENGVDASLQAYARSTPVVQPLFFPLGTDGVRGVAGVPGAQPQQAPQLGAELDRARALVAKGRARRRDIESLSPFSQTFQCSPERQRFLLNQSFAANNIEPSELISNLLYISEIAQNNYGFSVSQDAQDARNLVEAMPGGAPDRSAFTDPFLSQVILTYLLARYGYTASAVLGPSLAADVNNLDVNPPLAFDYCHTSHVAGQATMWSRMLDGINKLITLLKSTPTPGGGTMWDRSMIYVASDFGRDKVRTQPGVPFYQPNGGSPIITTANTGHNLNNGALLISPMLNGGRVYGGMDHDNIETYGFNRTTGVAAPGTTMTEGDIYSVICQAMGIDFTGRVDMSAMIA